MRCSKKRLLKRTDDTKMRQESILTGFYGSDGKRIKHQVCSGALELPAAVLDLYEKEDPSSKTKKKKQYELPHLEAAVRPSLQDNCIITYVQRVEQTQDYFDPVDGLLKQKTHVSFQATNKLAPQRLRGGGGDDDVEMKDASTASANPAAPANPTPTTAVQAVPATAAPQATPAAVPQPQAASKPPAQPSTESSLQPPQAQAASQAVQPETQPTSSQTVPAPATSNTTSSTPEATNPAPKPDPQVLPLNKRPVEQYETQVPSSEDAKGTAELQSFPSWYHANTVSNLERSLLPEWFDQSAPHRTEASYIQAREKLLKLSTTLGPSRYISFTMARRSIPGDAGSLLKLHTFLSNYGIINADAMNESTPTPIVFAKKTKKKGYSPEFVAAMAEQARKGPPIDWTAVSKQCGMTPHECERLFLNVPMEEKEESFPSSSKQQQQQQQESMSALVEGVDPKALKAVVEAALRSTDTVSKAQEAARVGVVAQQAAATAQEENKALSSVLNHVVELRLQKLENRLRALDDVEGMLDAERLSLALERRDLYTARCRHWFGGA